MNAIRKSSGSSRQPEVSERSFMQCLDVEALISIQHRYDSVSDSSESSDSSASEPAPRRRGSVDDEGGDFGSGRGFFA
jgi:hypothetical protein